MKLNHKLGYLFIFIATLLLCLTIVSAQEVTNDTNPVIKEESTPSNVIKEDTLKTKDTNQEKIITKNTNTKTKTANKKPVYFDITIRNNIVDNSTIEVGVINSNTDKPVPNSNLNITLPNKSTINTKTTKTGYVNVTMNLPAGKNILKINYPGTSNYYAYDYDLNMTVIKRNVNMNVNLEKTKNTGNVNLTIKLTDGINKNNINNAKTTIALSDGRNFTKNTDNKATATYIFKLNGGKNKINITFLGNNKYNSVKTNVTVDMGKIKNNVDYDVELNNLYVGKTSLSVTLKDYVTRKTIPNTTLKLKLTNGKTYAGKTNKKGVLTLNVDAPVGKNYMNITYAGNNNYNKRTATINFTVKKRVSDMNFTLKNNENPKLSITLKDLVLNKTISNTPVTITLPNGQKLTKNTNTNGQITYPITVEEGSKKVYKATYAGNKNVTSITKTLTVTKPKAKTPVTYNVTVTNKIYGDDVVVFTLIDTKTNKTISNAPLKIKLASKTVNATTNNKGQVTLKKNMNVGTNNVTLTYKGNTKYENRTTKVQIKIDKRPSTIDSSINVGTTLGLNLTLSDAITHKAIPNAKIVLKHPKTNVTLTTDKNGKIHQDIKLPAGRAEISLRYAGNKIYAASNVKPINITILGPTKTETTTTLNKVTGTVGEKVTITANVKDNKGKNVNSGTVIFKLNGKTLKTDNVFGSKQATKKVTVKNGKASVTLTATKTLRDSKNLTATYNGNDNYDKSTSKAIKPQIQLRKANLAVTTTPKTQKQYGILTFKVKVTDTMKAKIADNNNSYVIFKINGKTLTDSNSKTVKVKVVNQTATYKYKVPKGTNGLTANNTIKNYVLTAVFYNPDYYSSKNTTIYHVNRSSTKFNITTVQYTNKTRKLVIKGNIKDYKNYNVVGDTKINIKINGKSITRNNQTVSYTVKSGKINLSIDVPSTIKTINNVTLTSGNRLAYTKTSIVLKNIKQA